MHPTDYVLALADAGSTRDTLSYYATCEGVNPTSSMITNAEYNLNVMRYFVNYLGTSSCPDYDYLTNQVQDELSAINTNFEVLEALSVCDTYLPYWEEFFYDGVCSHAFDGMYIIWITQTLCAVCLLGTAMCSSSIFPYFMELKQLDGQFEDSSHHSSRRGGGMDSLEFTDDSGGGSMMSSLSAGSAKRSSAHNPMRSATLAPWEITHSTEKI